MKIVTVQQMRAIEKAADQNGLSYVDMMNNAGTNLGHWVDTTFRKTSNNVVLGLVGGGNNGGDTLIALTYLAKRGWIVFAYLVKARDPDDPCLLNFLSAGGKTTSVDADISRAHLTELISHTGIILDGMLGIGFKPPLSSDFKHFMSTVLDLIAKHPHKPKIIAVDCPSGVDCTNGIVEEAVIPADFTTCMAAAKSGLLKFPAFSYCGTLVEIPIGLPDEFTPLTGINSEVFMFKDAANLLPSRPLDAHKGTFGTCQILAGSSSYPGAAFLAGKAAYLSGAGLVEVLANSDLRCTLSGSFPEAIWSELPDNELKLLEKLKIRAKNQNALLVGPGIGTTLEMKLLFSMIVSLYAARKINYPLVIDADGLRLLSTIDGWWQELPQDTILTPHPGEMAELCHESISEIQTSRITIASEFAIRWRKIIVLKGAITVIADPTGNTYCIPVATSALSTAGTGDILAGLVAGFRAQGTPATDACLLATSLHADAGLLAYEAYDQTFSVTACDILSTIPESLMKLKNYRQP